MIDPKKVNLNQLPKKFIDGVIGGSSKDIFMFAVASGNDLSSFAATPRTMKSIARWLNKQVLDYEQKHGDIDMSTPKILSPITVYDLSKGGEK